MLANSFNYNETREKSAGIVSQKQIDRPRGQNSFSAGQKIIWDMKRVPNSFMDMKNFYLSFKAISAGVGVLEGIGAYTFISEMKVMTQNGVLIDHIKDFQNYMALALSLNDDPDMGNPAVIGASPDDMCLTTGVDCSTQKEFCLPFNHSLFSCARMLPMFAKVGLRIEWTLANVESCLLATGRANATYTITDVKFNYPLLTMDEKTFSAHSSSVSNYHMDFQGLWSHAVSVPSGSISEVHTIPCRFSSVNTITLLQAHAAAFILYTKMKFCTRMKNRLTSIQYNHRGSSYPKEALTCGTDDTDTNAARNALNTSEMFLESVSAWKTINSQYYYNVGNTFVLRTANGDNTNDSDFRNVSTTYNRENGGARTNFAAATTLQSARNGTIGTFFTSQTFGFYKQPQLHKNLIAI